MYRKTPNTYSFTTPHKMKYLLLKKGQRFAGSFAACTWQPVCPGRDGPESALHFALPFTAGMLRHTHGQKATSEV